MTFEKKTIPNELLVRWTEEGVLSGAHVKYMEVVREDGRIISGTQGNAIPISAAGDFPFQQFLPDIQAGAIASAERAWAETAAAKEQARKDVEAADFRAGEAEKKQALAEHALARESTIATALAAEVAALRAALLQAQAAPVAGGHDGVPV